MLANQSRIRTKTAALLSALWLISQAPLCAQTPPFPLDAAQVVLGSSAPQFQSLIDLDGNARLDALGMRGGNGVTQLRLYQNQGNGSFVGTWSHSISWSGNPTHLNPLAVGDFDGDGRRDDFAITAGLELRIFQGAALGATQVLNFPLNGEIRDLHVVDLDQNGTDDLIALLPSFVSIAMNPLGANPSFLNRWISSSIPGSELLVISRAGGGHSIFGGSGHFLFTPGVGLSTAGTPGFSVAGHAISGDLDGDGDEDGIAFEPGGQYRRMIQGPPGVFTMTGPHSGGPASALIDLDGDGDLDGVGSAGGSSGIFTVPNQDLSRFVFCENDGSGHFGAPRPLRSSGAQRLAGVSDLDGDGHLDFIAGRSIYFGRSSSVLARPIVEPNPDAAGTWVETLLDIDDDGDIDFELFDLGSPVVYRNDGRGEVTLSPVDIVGPVPAQFSYDIAVADWNRDGLPDVISTYALNAYVAYNLGGGAFSWRANPVGSGTIVHYLSRPDLVVDLDNDGDLDVLGRVQTGFNTSLAIAIDTGFNNFVQQGTSFPGEECVGAADFDNDGLLDLVTRDRQLTVPSTGILSWIRHAPLQVFTGPSFLASSVATAGHPLLHDMDFDGDIDILAFVWGVGHVVFDNDGSGVFTQTVLAPSTASLSNAEMGYCLSDLDGDGITDILAAPAPDALGCAFVLQGTGTSFVPTTGIFALLPSHCADLDGDGDDDIIETLGGFLTQNLLIDGPNTGSRRQYGIGTAGSGGLVPTLGASGPFREGGVATLRLRNALGGATAVVVLSAIPSTLSNQPVAGMTSYVDPFSPATIVLAPTVLSGTSGQAGTGSANLPFNLPVGIAGLTVHHQAFILDPQGPSGISCTEGLSITYGL